MSKHMYYGKILAEIAEQNNQGRFQNTEPTDHTSVYEQRRQLFLAIRVGSLVFEYNFDTGHDAFVILLRSGERETVLSGWDGLTDGQQMTFVAELYEFMYRNHMTGGSLHDFIDYLSKRPR